MDSQEDIQPVVETTSTPTNREYSEFALRGIGACSYCIGCSENLPIQKGHQYLVKSEKGEEYAQALFNSRQTIPHKINPEELQTVLRELNENDLKILKERCKQEQDTLVKIKEKVKEYELNMKVTNVEYNNDESVIFCYFTAPERVDFRELVRDLGHTFKKRIELKQIGARDETKMIGGCGHCGLRLCCNGVFRTATLPSVSMKMAKAQKLSSNPQTLLGPCSKLRCCLEFEYRNYMDGHHAPASTPVPESEGDNKPEENLSDTP